MMMTIIEMIILRNGACTSKENIKFRSYPRRAKEKKRVGAHIHVTHET